MRTPARKSQTRSGARRYLVHLSCVPEETTGNFRYLMRIRPWAPRSAARRFQPRERLFEDESELMRAFNPLLPHGSDVRHVLSYIERPEGFLYLLQLNPEQAQTLGWRK